MTDKRLTDSWLEEYRLIRRNPIYFLELYWNKLYPEEKVELTDEEKERLYNKYCGKPRIKDTKDLREYVQRRDAARAKGLKDWESFM